jgi:hypothetical protein
MIITQPLKAGDRHIIVNMEKLVKHIDRFKKEARHRALHILSSYVA